MDCPGTNPSAIQLPLLRVIVGPVAPLATWNVSDESPFRTVLPLETSAPLSTSLCGCSYVRILPLELMGAMV
ncbi:MAG: hypothetical protein ACLQU5_27465 [Isosphaeraceae bacterium]